MANIDIEIRHESGSIAAEGMGRCILESKDTFGLDPSSRGFANASSRTYVPIYVGVDKWYSTVLVLPLTVAKMLRGGH